MGMDARDIGVFVFLFTQRWFEGKKAFSASEITKTLKPISSMVPEQFRTTYSEKYRCDLANKIGNDWICQHMSKQPKKQYRRKTRKNSV